MPLLTTPGFRSQIDQTSLGLEREFLVKGIDEPLVQAYLNFMVDNAVIFGANRTVAEAELKEALEFEIQLAKVRSSRSSITTSLITFTQKNPITRHFHRPASDFAAQRTAPKCHGPLQSHHNRRATRNLSVFELGQLYQRSAAARPNRLRQRDRHQCSARVL